MNYKFIELSYSKFACDALWCEDWTKEFLKEILPEQMYKYLYDITNQYNYELYSLIQSLIKLCGYSEKELIHFEHFEEDRSGLNSKYTIFAKNDFYTMRITSGYLFESVIIEFYNNETNNLFCTLNTGLSRDANSEFIHRYKDLVLDCFERNADNETYHIGRSVRGTYGYYVIITGNAYFVPYKHVDHLEDGEDWKTIYDAQKEYFDIYR